MGKRAVFVYGYMSYAPLLFPKRGPSQQEWANYRAEHFIVCNIALFTSQIALKPLFQPNGLSGRYEVYCDKTGEKEGKTK